MCHANDRNWDLVETSGSGEMGEGSARDLILDDDALLYIAYVMLIQGCKFSDFCLISESFTSKYLKMFFEISSL